MLYDSSNVRIKLFSINSGNSNLLLVSIFFLIATSYNYLYVLLFNAAVIAQIQLDLIKNFSRLTRIKIRTLVIVYIKLS